MTVSEGLVADYLQRLGQLAAGLPPDRRDELLAEIRAHIDDARAAGDARDEAAVRTLLDRLGDPADIVAAAQEDAPVGWGRPRPGASAAATWRVPPPGWTAPPRGTGLELAAVLMLTAGSFIPVIGWLVGVVLLWVSSLWTVREKLLGTLVWPLGPGMVFIVAAFLPVGITEVCSSSSATTFEVEAVGPGAPPPFPSAVPPTVIEDAYTCTTTGPPVWVGPVVSVALLIAPIVVAVVLLRIARRRAAEPST